MIPSKDSRARAGRWPRRALLLVLGADTWSSGRRILVKPRDAENAAGCSGGSRADARSPDGVALSREKGAPRPASRVRAYRFADCPKEIGVTSRPASPSTRPGPTPAGRSAPSSTQSRRY